MSKPTFINLPVANLVKSTEFYLALGFTINPQFSDQNVSAMVFNKHLTFMLLTHEFYSKFTSKEIADTHKTSAVLISLGMHSKEEVQKFADTAKAHGGNYYMAEPNKEMGDLMFVLEVEDLDGHILEPAFMDYDKFPKEKE
jgi:uncharacterized protein